jgi:hypothetical protein
VAELFSLPETLSPRLEWLREKNVQTKRFPFITPGDEDEFGNDLFPWYAWTSGSHGETTFENSAPLNRAGGNTEQEAIRNLAVKREWRLWNEKTYDKK